MNDHQQPPDRRTLREVLDRGALSTRQAIDIGVQIAEQLAAAHARGTCHPGLDPASIAVGADGRVEVLGFEPEGAGEEGAPSAYMAPERLRGGELDPRSDLFSFGVVLYEMLTGLSPFRRVTDSDTVEAVLEEDPPPVSHNSSRVLPVFDGIVQRCLEKRPENRYRSPAEIVTALRAIGEAPAVGKLQSGPRVPYTPFALIPIIIAAALALALLLVGYKALLHQVDENRLPETQQPFETGDRD